MSSTPRLDREVGRVVRSDNCSGCGACTLLDPGLQMRLDGAGFLRPARVAAGDPTRDADAARAFRTTCPGVRVSAARPAGSRRHPTMGPFVSAWAASATDPDVRHRGSSGGALTALVEWLLSTGESSAAVSAAPDAEEPRRTVSVRITSREQALASAGSRYAPTASAAVAEGVRSDTVTVGKPCEISAVRGLLSSRADSPDPLLLSFFCAGTPSQDATDSLVEQLGLARGTRLRDLWYRGRGWPGSFTAVAQDGTTVSASYERSWGEHLGRAVQWRCKICPDGVGESSDITAADFWRADGRGFPDFTEGDGTSALIARTRRGHDVVERAVAAGVITVAPLDLDELAAVQPLQRERRRTLAGRLTGAVLAGRPVPRYRGFSLVRLASERPRATLRAGRGTFERLRALRRDAPRSDR